MLRGDPALSGASMADGLGSELAQLIAPLDILEFLAEHWERRPVHIPGFEGKFDHLEFDTPALLDVLDADPKRVVRAVYHDRDGHPGDMNVTADQAAHLFDAGLTIGVAPLDEVHPRFRELAAAAKTFLNLSGSLVVVAYWSPGAGGVGTHFDGEAVLILQLEGTKRWRFSPQPALASPRGPFMARPDNNRLFSRIFPWAPDGVAFPEPGGLEEAVLEPGDALYLPAGTWHQTCAADEPSLSLTVVFRHVSFDTLLLEVLNERLNRLPGWRAAIPVATLPDTPVTGLPDAVEQFFADRLDEVRALVGTLQPADLARAWRSHVGRVPDARPFAEPEADGTEGGPIELDDVLEVPRPVFCLTEADGTERSVHVFFGSRHVAVPAEAGGFVETLARHRRFTAKEALGWDSGGDDGLPEWEDVQEALQTLLGVGLIRRA